MKNLLNKILKKIGFGNKDARFEMCPKTFEEVRKFKCKQYDAITTFLWCRFGCNVFDECTTLTAGTILMYQRQIEYLRARGYCVKVVCRNGGKQTKSNQMPSLS